MTVPSEIKWTSHRPVILAAPDWPEMVALKEHAASLGADVEVSPLVRPKHVSIVWVPKGFTGSAAKLTDRMHTELITGGINEAAQRLGLLTSAFESTTATLRQFMAAAQREGDTP